MFSRGQRLVQIALAVTSNDSEQNETLSESDNDEKEYTLLSPACFDDLRRVTIEDCGQKLSNTKLLPPSVDEIEKDANQSQIDTDNFCVELLDREPLSSSVEVQNQEKNSLTLRGDNVPTVNNDDSSSSLEPLVDVRKRLLERDNDFSDRQPLSPSVEVQNQEKNSLLLTEDNAPSVSNDDSTSSLEPLVNVRKRPLERDNDVPDRETVDEKKLTRKRKRDPSNWKRNVMKNLRMEALKKSSAYGVVEPDQRGKKAPPQKKSEATINLIRDHIRSLPLVASHYCRSTTKRKYLPSGLSENRLYLDYKDYCAELGVTPEKASFYKHIFTSEFNIGFHRPKKDQCDYCTEFDNKNDDAKMEMQNDMTAHLARKVEAREAKKVDKDRAKLDESFMCFAVDMEKILLTPSLKVGKLYYKQKLKTFNFTVYNLANAQADNFMWHEAVGTKGSSEVATCLWKLLSGLGEEVKEVTFYADTASGQNRNCINAAMFLRAVHLLPIETINQKFMESGHSEMECDSVHSAIENRGNKIDIYTPDGWYMLARTAKTKPPFYNVIEMNYSDFLNFKEFSKSAVINKKKCEDGGTINWLKVKWIQYRKDQPTKIFFKERLSDAEFRSLVVKKESTRNSTSFLNQVVPKLYTNNLPIDQKKFAGLIKLCQADTIKSAYHGFYEALKTTTDSVQDESDIDED
ncbi:unnamed protein product [Callosobruchus maculatus]|uniref:Uncharacterized protein n=1 Tax=Callosobruchus maculatus TaxID=64391 RepID=A0A653CGN0_CALMS|nr:unnamed protein product [Callosobruchus maculatus]